MPNPPDYDPEVWPVPQPESGGSAPVGESGGTPIGGEEGPRDISEESRTTLADYLSAMTHGDAVASPNPGSRNYFAIEPGLSTSASPYDDPTGTPAIVTGGPEGNVDRKFTDLVDEDARVLLDTLSNSGKFDETPGPSLQEIIPKTSRDAGHSLLAGVAGNNTGAGASGASVVAEPAGATPVQQKISSILKLNRFSNTNDTPYIDEGEFSNPKMPTHGEFGKYDPDGPQHALNELRKIGSSLIFAATGHSGNVTEPAMSLEAVVPSPTQLMVTKVSMDNLRATSAAGTAGAPGITGLTDSDLRNDAYLGGESIEAAKSYGQLNSDAEPFSSSPLIQYPFGMAGLTVAGSLALVAGSVAYNLLLETIRSATSAVSPVTDIGRPLSPAAMKKGQYVAENQYQKILTDLGVISSLLPSSLLEPVPT